MSKLVPQPGIMDIAPYVPGLSKARGSGPIAKLSSNETPLGTSDLAIEAYRASAPDLHRYPDGSAEKMRLAIGQRFNLDPNRIVCGNGSDDLIYLLAGAFSGGGHEVLFPRYSFAMYEIAAQSVGATPIAAADEELGSNVDNLLEGVTAQTKVCFLANPNNPTGTYLTRSEINEILDKLPKNIIMVLDGAYAEYVTKEDYDNGFSLVDQFENIILTRTFSKAYGLAGLRLGWCYTSKKVSTILNKVKGPFNTQSLSQEMAIIALEDKEYLDQIVKNNQVVKDWFENELRKINIKTNPSEGNFTFVEMTQEEVKNISSHLASTGIIVRELGSYGLPNCLRITIGTKEEMEATIHSLKQI